MIPRGRRGINGDVGLNEAVDKCQLKVEEESGGRNRPDVSQKESRSVRESEREKTG